MVKIILFTFAHKTASMFAYKILSRTSSLRGLPLYSANNVPPNHGLLRKNYEERLADTVAEKSTEPYLLFGPARDYTASDWLIEAATRGHVLDVCQIRHPLDIITSQFFSHGWIHPDENWDSSTLTVREKIQNGSIGIYDYARLELEGESFFGGRAGKSLAQKLGKLNSLPPNARLLVKYETMIEKYEDWAKEITSFLPDDLGIAEILADLNPRYGENPKLRMRRPERFYEDALEYVAEKGIIRGQHQRTAFPGDYRMFFTDAEVIELRSYFKGVHPAVDSYFDAS